ncbi:hypothetical protein [Halomarina rubra]|uniref:Twin-arginine translocation signal domain-containing protein n=1 Tax=Halomarina rubra TaxID=2071873 RepID=A0ABD6AR25_9EURY|nr:hypothetical protein [Halomarina rubra]
MPSRRDYLAGFATAGIVGLAGCSGYFDREVGTVFRKTLNVAEPTSSGQPYWASLAIFVTGGGGRRAIVEYDPQYVTIDSESIRLSVTDQQHEPLTQRFSDIEYIVGLERGEEKDGMNGVVQRSEFNEMQLGAEATVEEFYAEDGAQSLCLHSTESRGTPLALEEESQFDIDDKF